MLAEGGLKRIRAALPWPFPSFARSPRLRYLTVECLTGAIPLGVNVRALACYDAAHGPRVRNDLAPIGQARRPLAAAAEEYRPRAPRRYAPGGVRSGAVVRRRPRPAVERGPDGEDHQAPPDTDVSALVDSEAGPEAEPVSRRLSGGESTPGR